MPPGVAMKTLVVLPGVCFTAVYAKCRAFSGAVAGRRVNRRKYCCGYQAGYGEGAVSTEGGRGVVGGGDDAAERTTEADPACAFECGGISAVEG